MTAAVLSDLPPDLRERVVEVPRTAALVYLELYAASSSKTVGQLARRTGLPQRSVRRGIRHLDDASLATSSPRQDNPPVPEWRAVE